MVVFFIVLWCGLLIPILSIVDGGFIGWSLFGQPWIGVVAFAVVLYGEVIGLAIYDQMHPVEKSLGLPYKPPIWKRWRRN